MTKQETEPIILDLFYRRERSNRQIIYIEDLSPREKEAADLWDGQEITVDSAPYRIRVTENFLLFQFGYGHPILEAMLNGKNPFTFSP